MIESTFLADQKSQKSVSDTIQYINRRGDIIKKAAKVDLRIELLNSC